MVLNNTSASSSFSLGNFDTLQILDNSVTVTTDKDVYKFETPRDDIGRIISVICDEKSREVTYKK